MVNFLEYSLGKKGPTGPSVEAPQKLFETDPKFEGPDVDAILKHSHEGAAGELVEMLTRRGVTSEEMKEARAYLAQNPQLSQEYRQEFMTTLDRVKDMSPDQVREILQEELSIINSPGTSQQELERYKKEGILAPLIVPLQMIQPAVGGDKAREDIGKIASKKVGKVKQHQRGKRMANLGMIVGITGGTKALDYTFGKSGVGKLVDLVIEKTGLERAMQLAGNGVYEAYQSAISLAIERGAPMGVVEQLALGKGLLTTALTVGILTYLGVRQGKVEKPLDIVNFKKNPIHAALTTTALGLFLFSGAAYVDKRITEAQPSAILAKKTKTNLQDKTAVIAKAGKAIEVIPQRMQEPIDIAVKNAFESGQIKVGHLTVSTWLALRGDVKDDNGRTIYERYVKEMGTGEAVFMNLRKQLDEARAAAGRLRTVANAAPAAGKAKAEEQAKKAEDTLAELEKQFDEYKGPVKLSDDLQKKYNDIVQAINNVNSLKVYKDLGVEKGFSATELVKLLSGTLPADAQTVKANFDAMIAIMERKENVTLSTAILGNYKFWYPKEFIRDLVTHQPSFEELYDLQKGYPNEVVALMRKVAMLAAADQYLADLERELEKTAKVKVELRNRINLAKQIPSLGFTEKEILALVVPEKGADYDFTKALHPSTSDQVWDMIWGSPEAWKMREALVKRDAVNNNMSESVVSQSIYKGLIGGIFVTLVIGSVWGSGRYRKKMNRIDEEDLDKDIEGLHDKEAELVDGVMNYAQALSSDVVGNLKREGAVLESSNLVNYAFKKHIAYVLRRMVLREIPDPRAKGRSMSDSEDGISFISQTSKRFSENDVEVSKNIRNAYVKQLNQWMDSLKKDPFGTIESLLAEVDPQFKSTAEALIRLNATTPGNAEREQALQDLKAAFDSREKSLLSAEASQLALSVARLEQRAEAVRSMVSDADDIVVTLDGSEPGLTKQNIVASYVLSDIDAEVFALKETISALQDKGATVTPPDPAQARLTEEEWLKERDAFLARERVNLVEGTGIAGTEDEIVAQYNSFVGSISQGIQPIKSDLEARLKAVNPNSTVQFDYGYNALRKGPTVSVNLIDARYPDNAVSIPFRLKVPSQDANTSDKALEGLRDWAKVGGVLEQRLRVNAQFDENRAQFQDAMRKLQSVSPSLQLESDKASQNADVIDAFMRSSGIMKAQQPLMEELIAEKALSAEQMREFMSPSGIWSGSFTSALERATRSRFSNLTDKKIIVAFDRNNTGYIAAVPKDAQLPVDVGALPDQDKMSILRASRLK